MSSLDDALDYFKNNRLKVIGSFWATSVAGVLAYEWRKPIPTSLKVIHARVIAQGACLAGLAALAAVEAYDARSKLETVQTRLEEVEKRVQ